MEGYVIFVLIDGWKISMESVCGYWLLSCLVWSIL